MRDQSQARSYNYAKKPGLAHNFVKVGLHVFFYSDLTSDSGYIVINDQFIYLYFVDTFFFEIEHLKYTPPRVCSKIDR